MIMINQKRADLKNLEMVLVPKRCFEVYKAYLHREAWKNKDAILLRITKPIISDSYDKLFFSFLQDRYADEIAVMSHDKRTKVSAREPSELEYKTKRVRKIAKIATNNPASRTELRYKIKPALGEDKQPRARIQFQLHEGQIVSTQVDIDPDLEGRISRLFTISPANVSGKKKPYHALLMPDDFEKNPKDLEMEQVQTKYFDVYKAWWGWQAWKNKDAILLRITKPIISDSYDKLFFSFLCHRYADEIAVMSHDKRTKKYVRNLWSNLNIVRDLAEIATKDIASYSELKFEIKPERWEGKQPRAKIQFQLYEGQIVSTQLEIDPDPEDKISKTFTVSPANIKGAKKSYHAIWIPDDFEKRPYEPPAPPPTIHPSG